MKRLIIPIVIVAVLISQLAWAAQDLLGMLKQKKLC